MNFSRISRQIPENSDVCRFFNQICENKSEICRRFWILWKLFTIFQNYSLHSLIEKRRACVRWICRSRSLSSCLRRSSASSSACRWSWGTPPARAPRPQVCIFLKCIFRKCIFRKICNFLAGSFSAVSKRNFARKYSLESSRRNLHHALLCTALKSHFFWKKG